MAIQGFQAQDFDVFHITGLEPRMGAIIQRIRPKLQAIGEEFSPLLSTLCGMEMFPHVAKHARRTVNPPNDTWVAWSDNKRGYKSQPHFQVGLWSTHLFIQFGLIYECKNKSIFAENMRNDLETVLSTVPANFYWSQDHTRPEVTPQFEMNPELMAQWLTRLTTIKKAELLCGLRVNRQNPIIHNGAQLAVEIENAIRTLLPLYRLAF